MKARNQSNFIDKPSRKGKEMNMRKGKSGQLTKSGRIYKNDLLDCDMTSQRGYIRKSETM